MLILFHLPSLLVAWEHRSPFFQPLQQKQTERGPLCGTYFVFHLVKWTFDAFKTFKVLLKPSLRNAQPRLKTSFCVYLSSSAALLPLSPACKQVIAQTRTPSQPPFLPLLVLMLRLDGTRLLSGCLPGNQQEVFQTSDFSDRSTENITKEQQEEEFSLWGLK